MTVELPEDIRRDLLRSAWIVESGRALVYRRWETFDDRFAASARRAERRAALIAENLESLPHGFVEPHAAWMRSLIGDRSGDVPLGDLLLVRLGDWVEAHISELLSSGRDEVKAFGDEEKADLRFPDSLPPAPPLEALEIPQLEPPGDVLFRFGILADLHIGSPRGEPTARAAIDDLNRAGVDLVIQLGDITDHGDKDEFELGTKVLAELEMPVMTMMGNHDVFALKEERLAGREYYGSWFGREPDGVLIEHEGFRFAVLDSIEHARTPFAPFDLITGTFVEGRGGGTVRGELTPPQHEILAEIATPGSAPAFVFLHHPPQPFTSFPPLIFGLRDVDTGRLHATVDSGNVWGIFAGHTHRNARTRNFDSVPAHEVAIPRDFPFGYATVDVTERGYLYRFHQISDRDFLESGYAATSLIQRRYAAGRPEERAFVWTKS